MPRKEPAQGKHTSPDNAGQQNLEGYNGRKDIDAPENTLETSMFLFNKSIENGKAYKGLWNEEDLAKEVSAYFQYAYEHQMKTCKAGLRLWLDLSRAQYYDWETKPEKYGYKSDIINKANAIMENDMINRAEKYPTANIFLLKSSHGHVEASRLDITSNGQTMTNADEVRDLVTKLGLDKQG